MQQLMEENITTNDPQIKGKMVENDEYCHLGFRKLVYGCSVEGNCSAE